MQKMRGMEIAVPLIFDDKKKFDENLGKFFKIKHEKLTECLIFLNSGGVIKDQMYTNE